MIVAPKHRGGPPDGARAGTGAAETREASSMMRSVSIGIVAGLLIAAFAGFGSSPIAGAQGKTLVYFIFTGFAYPYFAPMADGVKRAAQFYPDLTIRIVSANNSSSTEITQVREALAAGAKGIILNPVSESLRSVSQEALGKNIPVVTVDRDVTPSSARNVFIGDRDTVLGQEETEYAVKYLTAQHVPTPWNTVVLQGTQGASTAIDRAKGTTDALAPYIAKGSVKIVLNQSANFATATAESMISELLAKTPKIQLIICGNDAMALGAIRAVKDHGLAPGKNVFIAGADAQPETMAAIESGDQLDTVTHSPFLEAVWAVEAMDNYLKGVRPPAGKFPNGDVIIPMTLVSRSNVGQIAAWGTPETIPPLPYGQAKAVAVK
jgi:ABC-type sugar transport system substrate-binding protein